MPEPTKRSVDAEKSEEVAKGPVKILEILFSLAIFFIFLLILYVLDKYVLRIEFKKETRYGLLAGLGVFASVVSLFLGFALEGRRWALTG
ncbi:MAG: hypothetical protein CMD29_03210 [Flavobacteriales bacterium]|nr:hypothetical protein [Flavobacteriales bacterium]|tara:strand:- start:18 stop:287 length:270 start_codon:yes stop_codon:yes gene_type:complete